MALLSLPNHSKFRYFIMRNTEVHQICYISTVPPGKSTTQEDMRAAPCPSGTKAVCNVASYPFVTSCSENLCTGGQMERWLWKNSQEGLAVHRIISIEIKLSCEPHVQHDGRHSYSSPHLSGIAEILAWQKSEPPGQQGHPTAVSPWAGFPASTYGPMSTQPSVSIHMNVRQRESL